MVVDVLVNEEQILLNSAWKSQESISRVAQLYQLVFASAPALATVVPFVRIEACFHFHLPVSVHIVYI